MRYLVVAVSAVWMMAGVAQADDASAKALYTKNGCPACHSIEGSGGKIGPPLDKIGQKGTAYIKDAIVEPNKVVATGYAPNIMPQDFGKRLKPAEIDDLVAWLAKHK